MGEGNGKTDKGERWGRPASGDRSGREEERVREREGEGRREGRKEAEREQAGGPTFKGTWPMFIETYTATQYMHIGYCRTFGAG